MKNKDNLKDELQEIAPFLNNLKSEKSGFEVPKHYFHNLQIEVLNQLEIEKKATKNKPAPSGLNNFFDRLFHSKPIWALSSVAVLVLVFYFFSNKPPSKTLSFSEVSLEEISTEALDNYLIDHIEELDSDLLITDNEYFIDISEPETNFDKAIDEVLEDLDLEDLL